MMWSISLGKIPSHHSGSRLLTNIASVSAAAAIATTSKGLQGFFYDYLLITLYLSLHLAFTVLFGLKLRMWDNGIPGRCYNTDTISARGAAHPYIDNIYIGITAFWLWVSMAICTSVAHENLLGEMKRLQDPQTAKILSRVEEPIDKIFRYMTAKSGLNLEYLNQSSKRLIKALLSLERLGASRDQPREHSGSLLSSLSTWLFALGFASPLLGEDKSPYTSKIVVLGWAFIQYPVHGYMIYALRSSNEGYLSGNSENEWGFGQIVALVLVAAMLLECFKALVGKITISPARLLFLVLTAKQNICSSRFLRTSRPALDGLHSFEGCFWREASLRAPGCPGTAPIQW